MTNFLVVSGQHGAQTHERGVAQAEASAHAARNTCARSDRWCNKTILNQKMIKDVRESIKVDMGLHVQRPIFRPGCGRTADYCWAGVVTAPSNARIAECH